MTDEEKYKKQLMTDYHQVFQGDAGERVLKDICRLSGLFSELESNDPIEVARAMGKQDLAKSILALHGQGLDLLMNAMKQGEQDDRYNAAGHDGTGTSGTIDGWIS
jgi:hypothetical protein